MRIIALEEHFSLPEMSARIDKQLIAARGFPPGHQDRFALQLADTGDQRLAFMDEAGITMQVLSVAGPGADLLPVGESVSFAMDYNDALARIIETNPDRFGGFAHLPMADAEAAAKELQRSSAIPGFCGAMINGMTDNLFLDDERFSPLLAEAERLAVPLYLHPSFPPPAVQELYYGRLTPGVSAMLASAAYGWHSEVAIHVLRLYASGVFDRYPGLQIIIGHMGETLPFMMARAETVLSKELTKTERTLSETLRSQVFLTTSGFFTMPPLEVAIATLGIERILFSVDYPYSANRTGVDFLDKLSMRLAEEEVELIAHGNAERVLKVEFGM